MNLGQARSMTLVEDGISSQHYANPETTFETSNDLTSDEISDPIESDNLQIPTWIILSRVFMHVLLEIRSKNYKLVKQ